MRPHTGMNFNHSAINCLASRKILRESEMLQWAEWELAVGNRGGLLLHASTLEPEFHFRRHRVAFCAVVSAVPETVAVFSA